MMNELRAVCVTCEGEDGMMDGRGQEKAEEEEKVDGEVICILILWQLRMQTVLFAN